MWQNKSQSSQNQETLHWQCAKKQAGLLSTLCHRLGPDAVWYPHSSPMSKVRGTQSAQAMVTTLTFGQTSAAISFWPTCTKTVILGPGPKPCVPFWYSSFGECLTDRNRFQAFLRPCEDAPGNDGRVPRCKNTNKTLSAIDVTH